MAVMRTPIQILLIDEDEEARALARLVANARSPGAAITEALVAVDFVDAIVSGDFQLAIVNPTVSWSDGQALVDCLSRHQPSCAVLVFSDCETVMSARWPSSPSIRGFVRKRLDGVLELSSAVAAALGVEEPEAQTSPRPLQSTGPIGVDPQNRAAPVANENGQHDDASKRVMLATTAHDLQEPLRSVINYLTVLKDRHSDALEDEATELIGSAEASAKRMLEGVRSCLTPEMSSSAELESPEDGFGPTDCDAVFRATLENLNAIIERSKATVTADPLPMVGHSPAQMAQLLQNLISNAVKFRGAEPPKVHVSVEESSGEYTFSVADNGLGIDPDEHELIFRMFERGAHGASFPGTGIGLAICKKAAETNGGRIWVESTPGEGTTVFFTVPREAKEASVGKAKRKKSKAKSAAKRV